MAEDNSHAGQGSVLLDIGGDVGALVVTLPAELVGHEVEIRPAGAGDRLIAERDHPAEHRDSKHHEHRHPWPHVGVVGRPVGAKVVYSAVFGELVEGDYELYLRPNGPVRLQVAVRGAEVSEAVWPD